MYYDLRDDIMSCSSCIDRPPPCKPASYVKYKRAIFILIALTRSPKSLVSVKHVLMNVEYVIVEDLLLDLILDSGNGRFLHFGFLIIFICEYSITMFCDSYIK